MELYTNEKSKNEIKNIAAEIVRIFNPKKSYARNLLEIVERLLDLFDFDIEVLDDCKLVDSYAEIRPIEKRFLIRKSIYTGAYNSDSDSLFVVAHELGHLLMHMRNIAICKRNNKYSKYSDPEWQADEFAKKILSYGYRELKHKKIAS